LDHRSEQNNFCVAALDCNFVRSNPSVGRNVWPLQFGFGRWRVKLNNKRLHIDRDTLAVLAHAPDVCRM
jgi:hypothetical protein